MSEPRFNLVSALVVDDNRHMCALLTEMLQAIGIGHVAKANDGESARDMLQDRSSSTVDFVIADLNMHPVDGADLLDWVRNDGGSPNRYMPVIMLTGHTEFEKIVRLRDLGATEILAKPVTVNSLTHRLISIIDRPRRFVDCPTYFGPDRRRQNQSYAGKERRKSEPAN